jgi:ATP-dependent DNA helicase DinG
VTVTVKTSPKTFADVEAILKEHLDHYEERLPQQIGAAAVEQGIALKRHKIIQAGCGVGKSFMTMIPAILAGERVVIATATKALQDQVAQTDVPFLAQYLDFSFAVLKGRGNYFCGLRADLISDEPTVAKMKLEADVSGFGGTKDDFSGDIPDYIWAQVCSDSDECDEICKESGRCFGEIARERAKDAQVLVVNQSLLFTDLVISGATAGNASMLGKYGVVILDEVHEAKAFAQSVLGSEFSERSITSLLTQVRNFAHKNLDVAAQRELKDAEDEVLGAKTLLWMAFNTLMKPKDQQLLIDMKVLEAIDAEWVGMAKALIALGNVVSNFSVADLKLRKRLRGLQRRSERAAEKFNEVCTADFMDIVRWIQVEKFSYRGKWDTRMVIKSQPLDVAPFLSKNLFEGRTVIMTSATCKVAGQGFKYLAQGLGVYDYDGLDVGTVFDYPSQAGLYIPSSFPNPKTDAEAWEAAVPLEIIKLITAAKGGALVLFTSIVEMNRCHAIVEAAVPYKCFRQGNGASVPSLVAQFAADEDSCLFGVRTFMTGIDVPGNALRMVILNKLPFAVPSDPMVKATCNAIKARGGNDFMGFAVPHMSLILEQASGRLIRSKKDKGVFVVLDSRMRTAKFYGPLLIKSLPPMKSMETFNQVEEFFS